MVRRGILASRREEPPPEKRGRRAVATVRFSRGERWDALSELRERLDSARRPG